MTPNHRAPGTRWRGWVPAFAIRAAASMRRLVAVPSRRRTGSAALPVDLVTISHTVERALAVRLDLPERAWVDTTTHQLRGHLALLLHEDLGDTDDTGTGTETPQTRALRRTAHALLDRGARPDPYVSPAHAYDHMRALAWSTRAFAARYRRRQGERNQ